ncbi:hypothetical protein LSTR_LSTR009545 [Laodelphax striatellus]|uniref:Uncharacterized protein n=1 Tax=Laodelphax striatellus TaxID=195883 RepID=A0A482WS54_LAOST|nr:hypothetical protein LSTR_LSTR009545 [Laodelphax striatellus]
MVKNCGNRWLTQGTPDLEGDELFNDNMSRMVSVYYLTFDDYDRAMHNVVRMTRGKTTVTESENEARGKGHPQHKKKRTTSSEEESILDMKSEC